MPFIIIVLFLVIGTIYPTPAKPADRTTKTETYTELVEQLRNHPEIQAYIAKAKSLESYSAGEHGLPDPVLVLGVQDFPVGNSTSQGEQEKMLGFKQDIPGFGIRGAKAGKIKAESRKTKLMADYAFASMEAKLIATLANWQRIKTQEKILKQQLALFTSEGEILTKHIAAHRANVADLTLLQSEQAELEITLSELEEQKQDLTAMFINMLGEMPDVSPPPIKKMAWKRDVEKTYPVTVAAQDVTMAERETTLRKAEFGPSFEVEANYMQMYNGDNAGTVSVGISFPLWAPASQKPKLDGAKAALNAAKSDLNTVRRQTVEMLSRLQAQIQNSARKITLLKGKQASLEQTTGAMVREYEAGKVDIAEVLKAKRNTLATQNMLAEENARHVSLIAEFNHYFMKGAQS